MNITNNDEYFEMIGWGHESDRSYFYKLNTEMMQKILSVAAIFSNIARNTFVGMEVHPDGTSGVLEMRVMGLNNYDIVGSKLAGELMDLLSSAEKTSFVPTGGDMIIKIVFPDLYSKEDIE